MTARGLEVENCLKGRGRGEHPRRRMSLVSDLEVNMVGAYEVVEEKERRDLVISGLIDYDFKPRLLARLTPAVRC